MKLIVEIPLEDADVICRIPLSDLVQGAGNELRAAGDLSAADVAPGDNGEFSGTEIDGGSWRIEP